MTTPPVDEPRELPPSRIVRWTLLGAVILVAVGMYFRSGLRLPPLGSAPPADTAPTPAR